ncbi:MAG: GGDEF domain-containing protein [Magnetococcales bacterium]|nr:GGDEF domain-containing protein [Magnetococcales bacterium]
MSLPNPKITEHIDIIKNCKLFERIAPKVYQKDIERCDVILVDTNEVVIDIGSDNSNTYMVLDGVLSIHLEKLDNTPIRYVKSGETVGELSLLGETKATAIVTACNPCHLLVIPRKLMWGLIRRSAHVSQNLLFILTDWIILDNERFIDRTKEVENLKNLSQLDGLTGLINRRELDKIINRIYTRSQMSGNPFSIIMIDVDHFKKYNDNNGHQGGDQALIALANVLKEEIRPGDIAGRYGGEEFTVVLPDSTANDALHVAERLRKATEIKPIISTKGTSLPSITVSIGIGESTNDSNIEDLIKLADSNLYKAKKSGRNCCCL